MSRKSPPARPNTRFLARPGNTASSRGRPPCRSPRPRRCASSRKAVPRSSPPGIPPAAIQERFATLRRRRPVMFRAHRRARTTGPIRWLPPRPAHAGRTVFVRPRAYSPGRRATAHPLRPRRLRRIRGVLRRSARSGPRRPTLERAPAGGRAPAWRLLQTRLRGWTGNCGRRSRASGQDSRPEIRWRARAAVRPRTGWCCSPDGHRRNVAQAQPLPARGRAAQARNPPFPDGPSPREPMQKCGKRAIVDAGRVRNQSVRSCTVTPEPLPTCRCDPCCWSSSTAGGTRPAGRGMP